MVCAITSPLVRKEIHWYGVDRAPCSGVNTGFGGSADTRTEAVEELQRGLMRGLHYGILAEPVDIQSSNVPDPIQDLATWLSRTALPLDDPAAATCMPESWVRASMLIRLNSLASGVSGVRLSTVDTLMQLLEKNVVPRIPIRGSISASGDLSPLSYVGGVMQGKPTVTAWVDDISSGARCIARADIALATHSINPVKLEAKEGLAIVNGTAISAGVGALAMHEALFLTALSQILTAMSVEALGGTDESFDPFFAQVRPHPGQQEAAQNILAFLAQSALVRRSDGTEESSLRQDRYSIRTAAQWIGPVLEDLLLSHEQMRIEFNSVTDNPLIDTKGGRMLHGGNFQAKCVTSAMEKTRQACQTIGRMLSVQCTELINPVTNRGLPPNLVVDEPSGSFIWKGTDIMVAALQSELGFLANPVGTHVQTAEMGNQALNSLALISCRYTLDALDVLAQMSAAHLLALCQAFDLRAMNIMFLGDLRPRFCNMIAESFAELLIEAGELSTLQISLWEKFKLRLDGSSTIDSVKRFTLATECLQPTLLRVLCPSTESLMAIQSWSQRCSAIALQMFRVNRDHYFNKPDATPYLGIASRHIYKFIRKRLEVPFLREDTIKNPSDESIEFQSTDIRGPVTVGSFITVIYQSIRTSGFYSVVVDCLQDVTQG
jgi:phenylalanine ammonia-lyase